MNHASMQRVMIVGAPGSGKSTLAVKLGKLTGLPVYHMDHIHWKSGWIERDRIQKGILTNKIHRKERWIFEGGHSATYAQRVSRADTLIWLDFPLWLRVWRVLHRSYRYRGKSRPDLPDGCPEQLSMQTVEFLGFIWRTRNTAREKIARIYNNAPDDMQVVRLANLRMVNHYLSEVSSSSHGTTASIAR